MATYRKPMAANSMRSMQVKWWCRRSTKSSSTVDGRSVIFSFTKPTMLASIVSLCSVVLLLNVEAVEHCLLVLTECKLRIA